MAEARAEQEAIVAACNKLLLAGTSAEDGVENFDAHSCWSSHASDIAQGF